jgi:hypothetical protein
MIADIAIGCLVIPFQSGRASAPMIPDLVHTICGHRVAGSAYRRPGRARRFSLNCSRKRMERDISVG